MQDSPASDCDKFCRSYIFSLTDDRVVVDRDERGGLGVPFGEAR